MVKRQRRGIPQSQEDVPLEPLDAIPILQRRRERPVPSLEAPAPIPEPEPAPPPASVASPEPEPEPKAQVEVDDEQESQKKRDRSWDAARSKATYDLPSSLKEEIKEIAKEISESYGQVTVNDVARLLLEAGITTYRSGQLTISPKPAKIKLFED